MALPDLDRCTQTLVAVCRRQADVDNHGVQRIAAHLVQKVVRISALGNDLEPRLVEKAGKAFAQENAVFGDRYAHGISALTRVLPPTGVHTRRRPPSASTRSASPRKPVPPSVSAPPIPLSTTSTTTWPWR